MQFIACNKLHICYHGLTERALWSMADFVSQTEGCEV